MQLGFGPVVGHPGPCGVVAEDQPDALKGQLAEYPEAERQQIDRYIVQENPDGTFDYAYGTDQEYGTDYKKG